MFFDRVFIRSIQPSGFIPDHLFSGEVLEYRTMEAVIRHDGISPIGCGGFFFRFEYNSLPDSFHIR